MLCLTWHYTTVFHSQYPSVFIALAKLFFVHQTTKRLIQPARRSINEVLWFASRCGDMRLQLGGRDASVWIRGSDRAHPNCAKARGLVYSRRSSTEFIFVIYRISAGSNRARGCRHGLSRISAWHAARVLATQPEGTYTLIYSKHWKKMGHWGNYTLIPWLEHENTSHSNKE